MTQKEIAGKLNISQATVSMALNRSAGVSAELQKKIIELAAKSGYQPNMAGRTLRCRKSNVIAVVLPSVTNRFYAELFEQLQTNLGESGYLVYLMKVLDESGLEVTLNRIQQLNTAGIIAFGAYAEELLALRAKRIPLVFYGGDKAIDAPVSQVLPDREQAAFELISFMITKGRRRIAFLGQADLSKPRFRGYCRALEQAGIKPDEALTVNRIDGMSCGYQSTQKLLSRKQMPDAIFCHNDEMAIGAKRALIEAQIRIPEDIALAGFDNTEACNYLTPSLTSIEQPKDAIIGALTREIIASIENIEHHRLISIPCRLILREST